MTVSGNDGEFDAQVADVRKKERISLVLARQQHNCNIG
jgi:hypothetical protein